jgi:uncharacterized membrane protein
LKKLAKNWKQRLLKSYSSLSIIANILVALSVTGLSIVGVISVQVSLPILLAITLPLGLLGLIGRVIDQGLDDIRQECKGGMEDDSK